MTHGEFSNIRQSQLELTASSLRTGAHVVSATRFGSLTIIADGVRVGCQGSFLPFRCGSLGELRVQF